MASTWEGALRALQPQFSDGGAPRAANPGTGAGPRAYAPGATSHYQQPPMPLARDVAPPTPPSDGPPPPQQAAQSPISPSPPPSAQGAASPDPMAQMHASQAFARGIVDQLIMRNRMRHGG